jgi:hypothetical protein
VRQLNLRNPCAAFFTSFILLMSQERQKFPFSSIPPVFCESHQHDLHQSELGQGNLPQSPYEQQYAQDFLATGGLVVRTQRH